VTDDGALPADCPRCGEILETRGAAMLHLLKHSEVWTDG